MKPLNPSKNPSPFYSLKLRITGYLCDCGHWNNIKRRKPKQNDLRELPPPTMPENTTESYGG